MFIVSSVLSTLNILTHWGRVTHTCVSKLTIISSDNGLQPGQRQAIIWTNAGILLIGALGTNVSEIFITIYTFSLKKMLLKMSSGKRRPSCLGLNVLTHLPLDKMEVCSSESNWQYHSTGLENGLAPNRWQTIIWTNADLIHWRICEALGRDKLIKGFIWAVNVAPEW